MAYSELTFCKGESNFEGPHLYSQLITPAVGYWGTTSPGDFKGQTALDSDLWVTSRARESRRISAVP